MRIDKLRHRVTGKGRVSRQRLVQHAGQRVDVCAPILFCPVVETLRRDVLERADRVARLRHPRFIDRAGNAEVNQIGEVVGVEQDVGRLDVTVDQADFVGGIQRAGDLLDDPDRACGIQRPVCQYGFQVAALDQAHVHIQLAVDFAVMVDRDDVGVIQTSGSVSLPAESLLEFLVGRQ